MSDHLDTENAGSVIEYSDQYIQDRLSGICKPLPMKISEIEWQLYVVRRDLGDINIHSLDGLGRLYRWLQRRPSEHAEDEVIYD